MKLFGLTMVVMLAMIAAMPLSTFVFARTPEREREAVGTYQLTCIRGEKVDMGAFFCSILNTTTGEIKSFQGWQRSWSGKWEVINLPGWQSQ